MCLCLCAGERPVSVSMTPSRRKARELHRVSLCGCHVCVNVPAHVSWCVSMYVCACRWALVLGDLLWGPQMLLRPLWTTFPPSPHCRPQQTHLQGRSNWEGPDSPLLPPCWLSRAEGPSTCSLTLTRLNPGGLCTLSFVEA